MTEKERFIEAFYAGVKVGKTRMVVTERYLKLELDKILKQYFKEEE